MNYKLRGDTRIKGDLVCPVIYTFGQDNDPDYATNYERAIDEQECVALENTVYEGDLVLDGDLYVTLDYTFTVEGSYRVQAVQPSRFPLP